MRGRRGKSRPWEFGGFGESQILRLLQNFVHNGHLSGYLHVTTPHFGGAAGVRGALIAQETCSSSAASRWVARREIHPFAKLNRIAANYIGAHLHLRSVCTSWSLSPPTDTRIAPSASSPAGF